MFKFQIPIPIHKNNNKMSWLNGTILNNLIGNARLELTESVFIDESDPERRNERIKEEVAKGPGDGRYGKMLIWEEVLPVVEWV